MTPVVEEREEPTIEPGQRTDTEDHVEQCERGGAERTNQKRFDRELRVQGALEAEGNREEAGDQRGALRCRSGASAGSTRRHDRWYSSHELPRQRINTRRRRRVRERKGGGDHEKSQQRRNDPPVTTP